MARASFPLALQADVYVVQVNPACHCSSEKVIAKENKKNPQHNDFHIQLSISDIDGDGRFGADEK